MNRKIIPLSTGFSKFHRVLKILNILKTYEKKKITKIVKITKQFRKYILYSYKYANFNWKLHEIPAILSRGSELFKVNYESTTSASDATDFKNV